MTKVFRLVMVSMVIIMGCSNVDHNDLASSERVEKIHENDAIVEKENNNITKEQIIEMIKGSRDEIASKGHEYKVSVLQDRLYWSHILEPILRFIPEFKEVNTIDSNKFLEAIYLYSMHTELKMEFENKHMYITREELEGVAKDKFGRNIENHHSFEFAQYKDEKYYTGAFSYHGNVISNVNRIVGFNDLYLLEVDAYFVSELQWGEEYDSIETVFESIDFNKNVPDVFGKYMVILKIDNQNEKEKFIVESVMKVNHIN